MISRSTILALTFACFATLSLAVAAAVQQRSLSAEIQAMPVAVYQMPRVVVVGKISKQLPADPPAGN